jgi:3-dehydroquinate synthase
VIEIRHAVGSYPVEFGSLETLRSMLPDGTFVITDDIVAEHYAAFLQGLPVWVFASGEQSKTLDTYVAALTWLADQPARRDCTVVAFGGGVVGDLAGFVASSYMRGVTFWQIPTTLLAQVDSSVGGKVGVDMPQGKNMVGSFYAPERVFVPLATLQTLPDRQFVNGMAEVWKYAFILDAEMVDVLQRYPLRPTSEHLQNAVERCILMKAEVVERDEYETTGERAILNFGHTVGHALERMANYEGILHGEAISIGMVAEAVLGEALGFTSKGTAASVERLLSQQGLPTRDSRLRQTELVLSAMRSDKKADREGLAFSLLTEIGECKLVRGVPEALVRRTLKDL